MRQHNIFILSDEAIQYIYWYCWMKQFNIFVLSDYPIQYIVMQYIVVHPCFQYQYSCYLRGNLDQLYPS